jgi:hypothetical protein
MSTLVYPEDFRKSVKKMFSSSQGSVEYDILAALENDTHNLGVLLLKYERNIKCNFTIKKNEMDAFTDFLTRNIQVINHLDLEALSEEVVGVIGEFKIEVLTFRNSVDKKQAVLLLCEWWQRIYDADQMQYSQRLPKKGD